MRYNNIAPQGTFIHAYMESMSEQETASAYDFWCAIWMLSCACGRDVIVDRPRAPVFLNIYAILVAESGITRKSSAVRNAFNIVREFNNQTGAFALIESKSTPETLDQILHERYIEAGSSRVAVAISELAIFLGTNKNIADMPALLTDLYDCPSNRSGGGTISRGRLNQNQVWLSFLSASTPSWLFRSVNPNVVSGGFTSRCLFIIEQQPKRRVAWPSADERNGISHLVEYLIRTSKQAKAYKRISITDSALTTFKRWYGNRQLHLDDFNSSFESREDAHVLRLAALLCVNDDSWIIQKSHITNAIKIIIYCKETASTLFEGTNARSKWIMGVVALRDKLLQADTDAVPRSQLYLVCRKYLDKHEFDALIDVMHECQMIQRFTIVKKTRGRPAELIRGTIELSKTKVVERITKEMAQ